MGWLRGIGTGRGRVPAGDAPRPGPGGVALGGAGSRSGWVGPGFGVSAGSDVVRSLRLDRARGIACWWRRRRLGLSTGAWGRAGVGRGGDRRFWGRGLLWALAMAPLAAGPLLIAPSVGLRCLAVIGVGNGWPLEPFSASLSNRRAAGGRWSGPVCRGGVAAGRSGDGGGPCGGSTLAWTEASLAVGASRPQDLARRHLAEPPPRAWLGPRPWSSRSR